MKGYFVLTEDHIRLLKASCVGWCDDEFGAACIDPKRPYGNSSVYRDIADILGRNAYDEDSDKAAAKRDAMLTLHRETPIALQIVLATGKMEAGEYQLVNPYDHRSWVKTGEVPE